MHCMITMHARITYGQTDEHHGNSATIRSNERIARQKKRACACLWRVVL